MDFGTFLLIVLGGLLTFGGLVVLLLYLASHNDTQATSIQSGQMKFIVAGKDGSWRKTLLNQKGKKIVNGRIVDTDGSEQVGILEYFGIWWVSIFYPQIRVHSFEIEITKIISLAEKEGKPIEAWLKQEPRVVNSLLFRIPRYTLVSEAEIAGQASVNMLLLAEFEVVIPYIPVFNYNGKFFPLLDTAIRTKAADWCKKKTYEEIKDASKSKTSEFSAFMVEVNKDDTNLKLSGIEEEYGIRCISVTLEEVELSKADEDYRKALKEKDLANLRGDGRIAESTKNLQASQLDAQSISVLGNAEAGVYKKKAGAVRGNPDAALVLQAENLRKMDNLAYLALNSPTAPSVVLPAPNNKQVPEAPVVIPPQDPTPVGVTEDPKEDRGAETVDGKKKKKKKK